MAKTYRRLTAFAIAALMLLTGGPYFGETVSAQDATQGDAQAAGAADEFGGQVEDSVAKLMALGIVQGKADGSYHPEQPITREEFAKLVVSMLGINQTIISSGGGSGFEDVPKGSWSETYVRAASQSGLIKGYEDGNFKPKENVSLAEAVAVVVRVLGYRDEHLRGEWPNNYISKAGELGLLGGLPTKHDNNVNRGIVAVIVDRALEANPIVDGVESSKDLLEYSREIYKVDDVKVLETYFAGNSKFVKLMFNKDSEFDGKEFDKEEEFTFAVLEDVDMTNGEEATVYVDSSETIIYAQPKMKKGGAQPSGEVEFDYITNGYSEKPHGMIRTSSSKNYLKIDSDAHVYVNGESVDRDEAEDSLDENVFGSFTIKGNTLEYANLMSWDLEDLYVESADAQREVLSCISTSEYTDIKINLSKYDEGYEIMLIQGGQKTDITLDQVVKGDMINISDEQENGDKRKIFVWRDSVSGRFARVSGGMNGQKMTFRIQGQPEMFELPEEFSYSYNSGNRVRRGSNRDYDTMKDLEDFYNENVQIFKNWKGDIVYIQGQFDSNSDIYGVLMQYGDSVRGEIKLYTHKGSKKVYAFEDSDEYDYLRQNAPTGIILKYSLAKSGRIKKISDNFAESIIGTDDIRILEAGDDFGEDTVTVDGKTLTVDSDTVYFDYTDKNVNKVKKLTWDKFKNREVVEDVEVIVDEEDEYVRMLAIWDNFEGIKEETVVGYAVDNFSLGTNRYVEIYGFGSQTISKYKLEDEYEDMILGGRLVLYQATTGSEIKIMEEDEEFEFVSGELEDIKSDNVTIEGRSYRLNNNVEVFEGSQKLDELSLEEDQLVAAYVNDAKIKVIEILDGDSELTVGEGVLLEVDPYDYEECFLIKVGDSERYFSNEGSADYVFRDGYLQKRGYGNEADITEIFSGSIGGTRPDVKFVYNKYTDEIYSIWVDKNR